MNNTDLIRFMQDLVNNPEELSRYKQDPMLYLAQTRLSAEQQDLLLKFSSPIPKLPFINEEVVTVFSLDISPELAEQQEIDKEKSIISLEHTTVQLVAHSTPVIIEPAEGLVCRLLNHSKVYITKDKKHVSFHLHMCYVNPNDPTDQPFVFELITKDRIAIPPGEMVNFADAKVIWNSTHPVILTYDRWIERKLTSDSYYNSATNELCMSFKNPPKQHKHD
jgi:hypothetical protein